MSARRLPEVYLLRGDREARAYLHPVRMRILHFLTEEPRTISQVAAKLGVHPANLTHAFRKLLAAGLIRLVEERDVGRVVEKYYRAVALRFELREEHVPAGTGAGQRALAALERDLRAVAHSLEPGARDLVCFLASARVAPGTFERFRGELEGLVARYRAETRGATSGRWYSLSLALYPRAPEAFDASAQRTLQPRPGARARRGARGA